MQISIAWLKEWVNLDGVSVESLSQTLTDIGLEVEAVKPLASFGDDVVVGRINSCEKHPGADQLQVCKVDVATGAELTIVCGAPNARQGLTVAVATIGATLPDGLKIKQAKIRGQESYGMLCSSKELGLSDENAGILELDASLTLGQPIRKAMALDDVVLTLNVTPNRADCLGHKGVARDVSAKLGRVLQKTIVSYTAASSVSSKAVGIKIDSSKCQRFTALKISGVKAVASPDWLKRRISACGLRPVNLIVDLTNFVMLEMNHPVHAYDARDVKQESFVIREAKSGESIKTLDGQVRSLSEGDLLICDASNILGIAGVMGGFQSEIKPDTSEIILEVAGFDPISVRKTSKRLGIHTEASHRFERGVDAADAEKVARRFAHLLERCSKELGLPSPSIAADVKDSTQFTRQPKMVAVRLGYAKSFLCMNHLTVDGVKKSLDLLGFRFVDQNQERLLFEVPSWRMDCERECDLVEEIGRMAGFDKVPVLLPTMSLQPTPEDPLIDFIEQVRWVVAGIGLRETISFPFWSGNESQKLLLSNDSHPLWPSLKIINPIADDAVWMRTTLVPSLLKQTLGNRNQGTKGSRLFEIGRGFFRPLNAPKTQSPCWISYKSQGSHLSPKAKGDMERPIERQLVAGVIDQPLFGKVWDRPETPATAFHGKEIVASLLEVFGIQNVQYMHLEASHGLTFVHPKQSAVIARGDRILGWIGQLHPRAAMAFGFDVAELPVLFELDLELIHQASTDRSKISSVSYKFPPSTRDLAMLVDESVSYQDISTQILKQSGSGHLKDFRVFDVYRGANIPAGKKSMGLTFLFQSAVKTLTDQEVEGEFKGITDNLLNAFGAERR